MSSQVASFSGPNAPQRAAASSLRQSNRLATLLAFIALAVALAWWVTVAFGLTASSRLGYWLGVAGGSTMLVVFLYPLRKRIPLMRRWGAAKPWFVAHMVCGIFGPLLVLVHSGFHIGSVNAGVATACMLVVAASGVAGRFVYVRIHRGLTGAHWTLAELNALIGASDAQVHSRLAFAPRVEELLHAYRERLAGEGVAAFGRLLVFMTAGLRARAVVARCRRELTIVLAARAAASGWSRDQHRRALAKSRRLVEDYVDAVRRAAQLATYERIFSWWHLLHLPLVLLLVLSAVAHVIAVHAY